jgi:uncharacterized protein (DUF983 family)
MSTKGRCPKCGERLWFGPLTDKNALYKLDISKRWNDLSCPTMTCRRCGVALKHANALRFNLLNLMAVIVVLAVVVGLLFSGWTFLAAAIGGLVFALIVLVILFANFEYVPASEQT